jgi:hypothetical protein
MRWPLVDKEYDFILIDCPPALSMLTLNGLCAAHGVIIPMQCEYYALEGLSDLVNTIKKVHANLNPDLKIIGLLRVMFDPRMTLSQQVSAQLEQHFGDKVFKTIIPRNVRLAEAPSYGVPGVTSIRAPRARRPTSPSAPRWSSASRKCKASTWQPKNSKAWVAAWTRCWAATATSPRRMRTRRPNCLSQMQAGKYQPRTRMDEGGLQELAASIKTQGIMQPILVRPIGKDKYEIIAGERRFRAATGRPGSCRCWCAMSTTRPPPRWR